MSRPRERGKTHGMVDSCKSGGRLYICTDNTQPATGSRYGPEQSRPTRQAGMPRQGRNNTQMMHSTIAIRQETAADFTQVREVIRAAFQDIEESDHTEHLLVDRLRQSDAYIAELSLVAETADGQIAGHIMLSKAEVISGDRTHTVLAVAPLSVLPAFQRSGIGSMLIREAHRRASDSGYDAAVLLGHKDYYPKFGYKKASLSGIKFPFDAPDECCMVAELKPGALKDIHGTVHYPDAFQIDQQ